MNVYLLRHGETEGGARYRGVTDDPLTENGWREMWAAVKDVAPLDVIITSPLRRFAEFAQALAQERNVKLLVDARWRELNFGEWESMAPARLWQEQRDALLAFWADPVQNPPPLSEPLPELRQRVVAAWRDCRMLALEQKVLVVSHGGPLRVLLGALHNIPLREVGGVAVPLASLHSVDHTFDFTAGGM